jgi:choline dehydrogenase-like flavoprotein
MKNALATRLVFDKQRATGIEVVRDSKIEQVTADREVILSAGSYGSPHLLMLSGIGPSADLNSLQIEVRADLPVGHHLEDHPLCMLTYFTDEETLFTARSPENMELLKSQRRGPLTSNIVEAGGFIRTRADLRAPDVQFYFIPGMSRDESLSRPFDNAFSFGTCLLRPTSQGKVSLRNARPDAKPRIWHNYFATEHDRRTMIEGIRISMDMLKRKSLQAIVREPHIAPASSSDEDIWSHVQRTCQTNYHPTSTCSIGKVVDAELRVYGFDALRVVDASIMPNVVRGNTNAPTIMIAEKAADMIKAT